MRTQEKRTKTIRKIDAAEKPTKKKTKKKVVNTKTSKLPPKRSKLVAESGSGAKGTKAKTSTTSLAQLKIDPDFDLQTDSLSEMLGYIKLGLMEMPEGAAQGVGRVVVRRTSDHDGVPRVIIGGVVIGDFVSGKNDELWDGQLLLVPIQKLKTDAMYGMDLGQTLTSHAFAAPQYLENAEETFRQNPHPNGLTDAAIAGQVRVVMRKMGEIQGQQKVMIVGSMLRDVVDKDQKEDEIWTGDLFFVPTRKQESEEPIGYDADQLVLSHQFASGEFGKQTFLAE